MGRNKIRLNIKFNKDNTPECAKSPILRKGCKDIKQCETMELYYYPFKDRDIKECFKNNEKRR